MAYIGKTPVIGNFVKLDSITVVNGQAAYTMQNGGVNFTSYDNVNQFLVSLNGVLQAPTDSFTVSSSTLTFASNLSTGDVIDFVLVLGNSLDIGTPSDNTITTAKLSNNAVTNAKLSFNANQYRNIIINGDMSIAQRSTSETSITSNGYKTIDRYKTVISSAGTWTQSQSTTVPSGQGFGYSLKMDCTTADASLSASDKLYMEQNIEGQFLQYLKKGTSSAESVTLSFWVRSNKTGTYIAAIEDNDNSRYISKSYTISAADTWEKKTITFAGDTTGTLGNDNATSFRLNFWLAAGSNFTSGTLATDWETETDANKAVGQVNLADSTSNEWYITGIQLEAGTAASDFEFLPVDVNMRRCQRYYAVVADRRTSGVNPIRDQRAIGIGTTHYPNQVSVQLVFPTEMRSVPSLDQASGTNYYQYYHETTGDNFDDFNSIGSNGVSTMIVRNTDNISASHGISGTVTAISSGNSYVALVAEL
jgi:hypothetical protein